MKKNMMLLLLMMVLPMSLRAEIPERIEETMYVVVGYDGNDYGAITFTKEDANSLFLLADETSFISVKKHLVYWWPITEDWRVDSSVLDINLDGTLEITDRKGNLQLVEPVAYTYFNLKGTYDNNWQVLTGQEALAEWERYMTISSTYQRKLQAYEVLQQEYEGKIFTLFEQYMEAQDMQLPTDTIEEAMKSLVAPVKPIDNSPYATAPSYIQMGYPVNLPQGDYQIRFLLRDGSVLEGTEKILTVFSGRRSNSVGYTITASDRWTQPRQSTSPRSVVYVDGSVDLYLQGHYQNEYQDLHYNKLIDNQSSGNPSIYRWVNIQQIPNTVLEVQGKGEVQHLQMQQYGITQSSSSTSGYQIVTVDETLNSDAVMVQKKAFHLPVQQINQRTEIELIDDSGKRIADSRREVRIVTGLRYEWMAFVMIAIPLVVSMIVISLRKRRLSS